MNSKNIIVGVVVFVILIFLFIMLGKAGILQKNATLKIGTEKITLTEVSKEKDLEMGLSGRKSLATNQGMIFLFSKPAFYTFWMKHMKFPIDIIYVNDKKIVTINPNAAPPANDNVSDNDLVKYNSTEPADKVIEVNAGFATAHNMHVGDILNLSL